MKDPQLAEHLAHWGIEVMKLEKTEKTMAELEVCLFLVLGRVPCLTVAARGGGDVCLLCLFLVLGLPLPRSRSRPLPDCRRARRR